MLINMMRLVEDSLTVNDGATAYFPETDTTATIVGIPDVLKEFKGRRVYCVKNNVLGFIVNDFFSVTPATEQKVNYLRDVQEFEEAEFFVPFSDGSFPEQNRRMWEELLEDARSYVSPNQSPD